MRIVGMEKVKAVVDQAIQKIKTKNLVAIKKTGFFMMDSLRLNLEKKMSPAPNPLSTQFKQRKKRWVKTSRPANFFELGKFARFRFDDKKKYVLTGFGVGNKEVKKFSPILMRYAKLMHGRKIFVTKKMRKKIAATGVFFIKKPILNIPKRLPKHDISKLYFFFYSALKREIK